jgi:hypothetical protein
MRGASVGNVQAALDIARCLGVPDDAVFTEVFGDASAIITVLPDPPAEDEVLTVHVPLALLDDVEHFAELRGLTRDEAVIRALRGFVASSMLRARELRAEHVADEQEAA